MNINWKSMIEHDKMNLKKSRMEHDKINWNKYDKSCDEMIKLLKWFQITYTTHDHIYICSHTHTHTHTHTEALQTNHTNTAT